MKEIINHTNYEGYFLLYVDNELTIEERSAVELFAAQHPEMHAELDMLLQTRIASEDEIVFSKKDMLLFGEPFISDKEIITFLDGEAVSEIAAQQLNDPSPMLQQCMDVFAATKMDVDSTVVFPGRERLMKQGRIVSLKAWKIVAAAAVIIVAFGLSFYLQDQSDSVSVPVVAVVHPDIPKVINKDTVEPVNNTSSDSDTKNDDVVGVTTEANTEGSKTATSKQQQPAAKPPQNNKKADSRDAKELNNNTATQPVSKANSTVSAIPVETKPPVVINPKPVVKPEPELELAGIKENNTQLDKPEKRKKSIFKNLGNNIKNRALDVLANGDEDGVTIAGFAVKVSR